MDWNEANAEHYESPTTDASLWLPVPGIVVTRASGVGELGSIRHYTNKMDRLLMSGRRYRVFHHWYQITSFTAEARSHLRRWGSERTNLLGDTHFLVSSKILAMAVAAAAMALRRTLVAYSREDKFVVALDRAIREEQLARGR